MRTHLTRSLKRYRRLAERQLAVVGSAASEGDPGTGAEGPRK